MATGELSFKSYGYARQKIRLNPWRTPVCAWLRLSFDLYLINNDNRTEWSPIQVCNHKSDKRNRTTAKRASDLVDHG